MTEDPMQHEFEAITQEAANTVAVSDLIPPGTYEGVLLDYTFKTVEFGDNPFCGHKMFRVHAELYDCPKDSGKTRHHYFDVSPTQVTVGNGLRSESRLGVHLANVTGGVGWPFDQVLEKAKEMRLRYNVTQSKAKDGYDPRNWTNRIMAPRKAI